MKGMEEREELKEIAEQFPMDKDYLVEIACRGTDEKIRSTLAEAEAKLGARK